MFRERLQELFTHHRGHVQRACKRYVQNREDADDLAMEVLIKAASGWTLSPDSQDATGALEKKGTGNARPMKNSRTWLYRIAANHCLDHLRRRKRRREHLQRYAANLPGFASPERWITDPEIERTKEIWKDAYAQLQSSLNPVDRHLLHLVYDSGVNQERAARLTGVSRSAIARGIARIREQAVEIRKTIDGDHRAERPDDP
jgi:RNA polymerase sigma factor (sigma-70 family)